MINTSLQAFELADRSRRMNLPTANSKGVQAALGSSSGTGSSETSRSETTSTWEAPSGPTPERPTMQFNAPEYSDSEVAKLRQRHAGPNIRRLRDVTLQSIGQNFENPNVRRTTVRQALQGYGSGLGQILASAQGSAVSQYGQKYQTKYNEAAANFNAESEAKMTEYQNLWKLYAQKGTQRTITNKTGTSADSSNSGMGITVENNPPRPSPTPTWSPSVIRSPIVDVRNRNESMPYVMQG